LSHYPWEYRREDPALAHRQCPRQYLVWQRFQAQVGHAFDAIQNGRNSLRGGEMMIPSGITLVGMRHGWNFQLSDCP